MWAELALYVGSLILTAILTPKPKITKPQALTEVDAPVAEIGKPIPVLFGERQIKGINVVWFGDLRAVPIRKKGGKK